MKNLKFLFAALCVAFAASFAACGDTNEPTSGPGKPSVDPTPTPDPTEEVGDTLTVAQAIAKQDNSKAYVKGYIVGWYSSHNNDKTVIFSASATADTTVFATNIVIADAANETDASKVVCVQLPAGSLRDALNLKDHAENLGKVATIYGTLTKYNTLPGLKECPYAIFGGKEIGLKPGATYEAPAATAITVADFCALEDNASTPGTWYELTGTIGGTINATYGNFDLTDATGTVYVYGLTSAYLPLSSATKATNDKSYASLGLVAGDNITIRGVKVTYNGKVEMVGGYLVKKN